jgi:hypothetical protein
VDVRVDETGDHQASGGIDDIRGTVGCGNLLTGANRNDRVVAKHLDSMRSQILARFFDAADIFMISCNSEHAQS